MKVSSVKIGHVTYRVRRVKAHEMGDPGHAGEWRRLGREILLGEDGVSGESAATLLHEIIHGILDHWVCDDGDSNERLTRTLDEGFCAVIVDNPGLFAKIEAGLIRGNDPKSDAD